MYKWLIMIVPTLLIAGVVYAGFGGSSNVDGFLRIRNLNTNPTCATATNDGDLCAADAIEANGALDIGGASTLTGAVTMSSTLSVAGAITTSAAISGTDSLIAAVTLDATDCGKILFVTDAADGDAITLPATIAGCEYTFMFVGSDDGALIDISPNANDAAHGSCTLAASVMELSGTDDADFGLTKSGANTGDTMTIMGDGTEGWYVTTCTGIWANN